MTEMLCVTTSCRSLAILIRSSLARLRSSSSRLCCSAAARWLLLRISSSADSKNISPAASPSANATFADGSDVTVSGTATDSGGGVVAGVEVSTDGGTSWHPATLTTPDNTTVNWTYDWTAHGNPTTKILTRATDDSGNIERPSAGITVNVNCP